MGLALYVVSLVIFVIAIRRVLWLPYVWALSVRRIGAQQAVEGEIVFGGSSSITFWSTLGHDMAPLRVRNCGFGGSMIAHTTHYLPRLLPVRPAALVLSAGSNDLAFGKSVARVCADLDALIAALHAQHPGVPLYFVSINRAPSRRLFWSAFERVNDHARAITTRDPLVRFIEASAAIYDASGQAAPGTFGLDRLHMTADGYARWTSVIKPRLVADLS